MSRAYSPVWLDPITAPLAAVYGGIVDFRNHAYDNGIYKVHHATVPTISIGGISAGGAAKTPLAIWTLQKLLERGIRCGLLSRGYRRNTSEPVWVSHGDGTALAPPESGGDEPFLIAQRFPSIPVLCDKNRVRGAKNLVDTAKVNVIVLDDGFQHRRLARDIDWVSLDTGLPRRALRMLPWGYLRERFLAVQRASAVWIKVSDVESAGKWVEGIRGFDIQAPLIPFQLKETGWIMNGEFLSLSALQGRTGVGFAGIAHPARFKQSLLNSGIDVKEFVSFGDHHHYSESDSNRLLDAMKRNQSDFLFTTEKDFVKLPESLKAAPVAVLRVDVVPLGEITEIENQLNTIVR